MGWVGIGNLRAKSTFSANKAAHNNQQGVVKSLDNLDDEVTHFNSTYFHWSEPIQSWADLAIRDTPIATWRQMILESAEIQPMRYQTISSNEVFHSKKLSDHRSHDTNENEKHDRNIFHMLLSHWSETDYRGEF